MVKTLKGLWGVLVVAVFMFCTGLFLNNGTVFADDTPDYMIQITPAKIELDLKPGQTTKTKFKIQNIGKKDFEFRTSVRPFSVSGDEYNQDLNSETKYNDIAKWITFSETEGNIAADSEVEIEAVVKVPSDVPAGGQYAMIMASMIEPGDDTVNGIKAEKQVGALIYAKNVAGNTRETGSIVEAKVPSFIFNPPIKATSVVENTGNVHAEATYVLQVYPLFGNEEVYTNEENPEKRTILPETRRLNTMTWDGAPQLGIFKVKQTVKFLDDVKEIEKIVLICPIWFLLIILVLIFLAVFWIVSRTRGRKE